MIAFNPLGVQRRAIGFSGQKYNEAYYLQQFSPESRENIRRNKAAYIEAVAKASPELRAALNTTIDLYGSPALEAVARSEVALSRLDNRFGVGGQFYDNRLLASLLKKQLP